MSAQSALAYIDLVLPSLHLLTEIPTIPLFGTESTVCGLQLCFLDDATKPDSRRYRTENIYGGQLCISGGVAVNDLYGLRLGILGSGNVSSNNHECCNGAQIATMCVESTEVRGIQLGGLIARAKEVDGLQVAGLYANTCRMNGIGISGFEAKAKEFHGLCAATLNIAADMRGIQIGLVNKAVHANGVQIGLYNEAYIGACVQIGAVNHIHDRRFDYLPVLNFRFD